MTGNTAKTVWGAIEAVQTGAIVINSVNLSEHISVLTDKANKSLSIWDTGPGAFTDNVYSSRNIGIGLAIDTLNPKP